MTVLPVGAFLINNVGRFYKYPDMLRLRLGINEFYLVTNPALIRRSLSRSNGIL